ncbi:DMT family transporter [Hyphococcus flavus]|uniref:DMT family transporter n=1 Tax=Hyphococcus flavus TaxID=1866326 RepID=A0AAE9ZGL1_9PROT|nr:DMT family transporter [Hyphococcus flavus]WDI32372.1 DMT family transporter [Hyphococcus flavus]
MNVNRHNPPDATLFDWMLFLLIVAFGGSSFVMIRSAVETMPPPAIAACRLWVGAIVLYLIMRQAGRRYPPFLTRRRGQLSIRKSWRWMIAVGVVGNVIPFFLFPWAQQYVESGLAGVYMAFMPIWTVALAFFFANEKLTGRKLIGFALGFIGVLILMGPDVLKGALSSDLRAQGALLFATLLYAASAVLSRMAPPIRPRVFASGMMLVAAIAATPALLLFDPKFDQWSLVSIASVLGLGLFPTGLNGVLIIMLIRRVGAGFMALSNYITPLWAVAMGAIIYHERLDPSVFVALAIIFSGLAVSQRSPFRKISAGGELSPAAETAATSEAQRKS